MLGERTARTILCAFCAASAGQGAAASAAEYPPLPVPRPAAMSKDAAGHEEPNAGNAYRALINREAGKNGLPPDIADAVAAVESGYEPGAIGAVGEVGLMQVRPGTAAMLGFKGDLAELAKPDVNVRYGVTYLSEAWRLAGGDLCRALMKYRAGHGEEIMSPLSMIYCGRVRAHLAAAGSPYAAGLSVPMVFDPALPSRVPAARRGPPKLRTPAMSRAFWAAEEARVKAITAALHAKWRQMASR
jgi:soluble lytic murein transglycosylase-like protein